MGKNIILENYSACWKFINKCRWHIVFSVGVFSLFFLIGFTFPIFFREAIINLIQELMSSIEGKGVSELISFIMLNNIKVAFIAIVTGLFIGVLPFLILVFNGYLLGFVGREVVERGGIFLLWRLLPHGIFELPAIFFSIGVGIKIGTDLFKKNPWENLKYNLIEGARFFLFVIVPFLIIAATIEGILIFYFS